MTYFDFELTHCPVELSLDIINRKWVLQIICDMFFSKSHFTEFKEGRPDLSNKSLSRCLKFMEDQGLIEKVVEDSNIEYFLTDKGKSLNKIIYDLIEFTLDNNKELYSDETSVKAKNAFHKQLFE